VGRVHGNAGERATFHSSPRPVDLQLPPPSAFGTTPIDQIGFREAQRFVAELAVRSGLLSQNPARGLALPQIPHKEPTFLNPAQVDRLASAIAAPYRTFVLVGAYAGLRHGELAALGVERVNISGCTIDVVETRTLGPDGTPRFGPPKSRAGRRTAPVPAFVINKLADHIASRGLEPGNLIWTSATGSPLGETYFRSRIWQPATVAAGLEGPRIHELRHTGVAMWSRSLASPRAAAKWAGHSNPALVLGVYGGVFDDESQSVMERLAAYATAADPASETPGE
jgi:integrase